MKGNLLQRFAQYIKQNKFRRVWQKFVRVLACIVVFCTTYVLILPAITAELATLAGGASARAVNISLSVYSKNTVATDATKLLTPIMVYGDASLADFKTQFQNNTSKWFMLKVRENEATGQLYVSDISGTASFSSFLKEYDTCEIHGVGEACKAFNVLVPYQYYSDNGLSIKVGNIVSVNDSYTVAGTGYYKDKLCTMVFGEGNETVGELTTAVSANTLDLIHVNLYDYNAKVNTYYNEKDKQYLGYQQDGGTKSYYGGPLGKYGFNFGNNITKDLYPMETDVKYYGAGTINGSAVVGAGLEEANYPVSGFMWPTLVNGYPAIKYNTAMGNTSVGGSVAKPPEYLVLGDYFDTNSNDFCISQNGSKNINGLFQYDENDGSYYFDCWKNHAQYDSKNNKFILYNQTISSNFMMYSFGNFLPFNNIESETKQASTIDRVYLQEIADRAAARAQVETDAEMKATYNTLSNVLKEFCEIMDGDMGSITWDATDIYQHYLDILELPLPNDLKAEMCAGLENLYSIDYDRATNFFFGMDMEAYFMQPKDGQVITNRLGLEPGGLQEEDMIYHFAGDDDVWIYVDDVLFLDLSGIHRHVGGKINFAEGKVYYYGLEPSKGDISDEPYKVLTFKQIITNAYANNPAKQAEALAKLNANGTFKNYTTHKFNFFYMERGAGSSVYKTNFNLPLLRENSVSVEKVLKKGEDQVGDPDFFFQILKAKEDGTKTKDLLVGAGVTYYVYDSDTEVLLRTEKTDENGIITIKGGERAEVRDVLENAGKYYVRELLDENYYYQYGGITIEGSAETGAVNGDVIGETKFQGVESAIADASETVSMFCFTNTIDSDKIGALSIKKEVTSVSSQADSSKSFDLLVKLDGSLIPVGMQYELFEPGATTGTKKTVTEEGVISLKAGQTAMITHLLASTKFEVTEKAVSAEGYVPFYEVDNAYKGSAMNNSGASGYIWIEDKKGITEVKVIVENRENAVEVVVPVTKVVANGDQEPNSSHVYTFVMDCVSSKDNNGTDFDLYHGAFQDKEYASVIGDDKAEFTFNLYYDIDDFPTDISFPVVITYRIWESENDEYGVPITGSKIDNTDYTLEVLVDKTSSGVLKTKDFSLKKGNKVVESADFVNVLISDLTLEKRVENVEGHSEKAFKFTISLADVSGIPLANQTFDVVRVCGGETQETTMQTDTNGKFVLENVHSSDQIKIKNLVVGTKWTITEEDLGIYIATWEVGSVAKAGATVEGKISSGENTAICTNDSSYELPEFGGRGTKSYILAGLAFMLFSAVCLLYKNNQIKTKKERKKKVMKNMRRIFSMLLVMAMVVAFALPGMTAKAAVDKYEVYQILTGDLTGESMTNAAWGQNAIKGDLPTALAELKNANSGTDQQKLDTILKYADLNSAPFRGPIEATTGQSVTITDLPAGYYLVKNVSGSQGDGEAYGLYVAKVTSGGQLQFTPKVSAPTVDKEVEDDNVNIGDTVYFSLTATMSDRLSDFESYKLKFTDKMSKGLTLKDNGNGNVGNFKVMVDGADITDYFAIDYIVNEDGTTSISVACVDILKITNPSITNGDEIVVKYEAVLNEYATIGSEGNENTVKLDYSNNPNVTTDDLDGDGIPNDEDPDIDGDGTPNEDDDDIDGDGIPNDKDPDDDGDGTPDALDPDTDSDGDGTPDSEDQDDDGDGKNDNVDEDDDGDGIPDDKDPDHPEYDQDGDGDPDITDPDDDNDGVPDEEDPDDKFDGKDTSDTPEDEVIVTTGAIKVIKTNEAGAVLSGAKFVLLNANKDKIAKVDADGTLVSWDAYSGSVNGYELTTNASGEIKVEGLEDSTYYLKETVAPAQYNLLTEMVQVTVNEAKTAEVTVINYPGTALPETGGIGTTIFYVLGGLMVAGAAVLLVTKKRMGNV